MPRGGKCLNRGEWDAQPGKKDYFLTSPHPTSKKKIRFSPSNLFFASSKPYTNK